MWLIWLLFGGICLVVALTYLTLLVLTPHPRPRLSSECTYSSHNVSDQPLPSLFDPASVDLTLVIPAYNEAARLPSMLGEALDVLENRDKPYEVLVVDDGSRDDTAQATLDCARRRRGKGGENVRLVRLKINRGKGGAVTHGMMFARGQHLLFADADGASQFSDLKNLESALELLQKEHEGQASEHGLVLGSRAHMVDTDVVVKRSFLRNTLMRAFHFYLHVLGISSIKDTQCGFKLCTRETARIIYPSMHVEGWIFDVELITIALLAGVPIAEVPITWREIEGSKMSLLQDSIKMALDLLIIRLNYTLGRWSISQ